MGPCTLVKDNITYIPKLIPANINIQKTELQITKIHLSKYKHIYIMNIYIPPRDTTRQDHPTEDEDITNTFTHLTQLINNIVTGDINARLQTWYSPNNDHKGDLVADIIQNSNHITLNTPTRFSAGPHQQPTFQDVAAIYRSLLRLTTWNTETKLHSDYLPIITTFNIKAYYKIHVPLKTYTTTGKQNGKTS